MKHIIPILTALLLLSSGFVGVSNTEDELSVDVERDEFLENLAFYYYDEYDSTKFEHYKEYFQKDSLEIADLEEITIPVESPQTSVSSGPMDSPWPMKCHDNHHTSRSSFSTVNITGLEKWRFRCGGVDGSPIIGDDGTIYFGDKDRDIYAIYPNGTLKWKYKTDMWITSAPALAEDGTLYVGTNGNNIFSINPDGTENWRFTTGDDVISSPAIDKNGVIYVGSLDGTLYALSPYGTLKWKYVTGGNIKPSPAIGEDGTIYFAADFTPQPDFHSYLYAIEVKNAPDLRIEMKGKIARLRVDFKNVGNVDATNVNWSISVEITNWWDVPKRTLYSEGTISKLKAGEKETRFAWPIFLFGYGFAIIDITVSAPDANNDRKEAYWLVFGPFIFPQ